MSEYEKKDPRLAYEPSAQEFDSEVGSPGEKRPELSALQDSLSRAHHRTTEVLASLQLPQIPHRDEVVARAKATFAKTPSLDEIVDRAYELLLASVGTRLVVPFARAP